MISICNGKVQANCSDDEEYCEEEEDYEVDVYEATERGGNIHMAYIPDQDHQPISHDLLAHVQYVDTHECLEPFSNIRVN